MRRCELRLLKQLGDTDVWKHAGRIHAWLYRKTNGTIGHGVGRLTNLLLTTIGRRSGESRTVALCYIVDGANYVLFGSNGGRDRHPAWWLNLRTTPRARVLVGDRTVEVVARPADPVEHDRLWPTLLDANPFYLRYARITKREIPVVILEPIQS